MSEKKCAQCDQTMKDHRWGRSEAQKKGWFLQKDGTVYCPAHVPPWVAGWRAKKKSE